MKLLTLSLMAFQYFRRYFRRYLFLFVALSFGFGIITAITSLQAGMEQSVYLSAQSHYAGDMAVVGKSKNGILSFHIRDARVIQSLIKKSGIKTDRIIQRTQFGNTGVIHFNGGAVKHKYVLGVNWQDEAKYLSGLTYIQGTFENWDSEDAMVVSAPVAEELNLQAGDSVLLEVKTGTGQINTGNFVIKAVVDDATIFGYYKCYINQDVLNKLIGFGPDECSTFGIYLKEGADIQKEALVLQNILSKSVETGPLVADKDELLREYGQPWKDIRHFVITLPVYLSEVAEILTAIELIAYFLYALMILIIIVSVAVTFRLILHEREKEIGTLRAVGFHEADIVFLLMMETVILFLCSLLAGFLFARFLIWALSFVSFSIIPSFEIFMKNGRLVPLFTLHTTFINSAIVLAALIPTVAQPVFSASRKPLPEMLSGGK